MELIEGEPAAFPADQRTAPAIVRLAIVDSDSGFTQVLAKRMGAVGWRADVLSSPPPVEQLTRMHLHAVVIDLARLGSQGWTYLEQLCTTPGSPVVLVCTGPSSVAQRVRGLRLGADDWVSKPCHPEEVLARIEAALRRRASGGGGTQEASPLVSGELEIRPDMFEAFVGGRGVGLTRREFELLTLLAQAVGKVIPRDLIYERVWGYAMVHGDRSVDVFVRKLRKKLEDASPNWRYLHTHFGVGYRFQPEEAAAEESAGAPEAPDSSATLPPA